MPNFSLFLAVGVGLLGWVDGYVQYVLQDCKEAGERGTFTGSHAYRSYCSDAYAFQTATVVDVAL